MLMPIKTLTISFCIFLISFGIVLLSIFIFKLNREDNSFSGTVIEKWFVSTERFEIYSEDPKVQLSIKKPEVLERYANEFGVFDENGLGIYINTKEVKWVSPKKIVFVYSPDPQSRVEVRNKEGEPFTSFEVKQNMNKKDVVNIYFNYDFELLSDADKGNSERLERNVSAVLVSILYRATHYNPKASYDMQEIGTIIMGLSTELPVLYLEFQP